MEQHLKKQKEAKQKKEAKEEAEQVKSKTFAPHKFSYADHRLDIRYSLL